jgi:hypothetical protein
MDLHQFIDDAWKNAITIMEKFVALAVIAGVLAYALYSVAVMAGMDWSVTETYYELINRVLAIIIGLELVRMLVSHSIASVLELLAFVIARKMLKPDLDSFDIMAGVLAFVALMAARHFFTESGFLEDERKKASAPKGHTHS